METTTETAPSFQLTEAFIRDAFDAIFVRKDWGATRSFWKASSVDHFLALGISVRGPEGLIKFFQDLHAAVPDLKLEIVHLVVAGREAIVQWRIRGTFSGTPFQGIRATGKPLELRGCDCFVFDDDGMLEENTVYYDGAEFARQIGMLPPQNGLGERAMRTVFNAVTRVRRPFA